MDKLLIIDGSGLLVSNYYGTLPKEVQFAKTDEEKEKHYDKIAQKNGYYINAIYPTIKQILDYTIGSGAKYLAVCFDKSRSTTFRKDLYEDYKANRKSAPEPLKAQFILCEELLSKMGIPVFYHDRYEADDIAGSISKQFSSLEKILVSKDKDYLQLVDKNSVVWMILHKKEIADEILESYAMTPKFGYTEYLPERAVPYDLDMVLSEKGVEAQYFSEVLALAGDSADNIPGVKGISEESAEKLIGHYKTVENLYKEIDSHLSSKTIPELKEKWKIDLGFKRSPYGPLMDYRKEAFLSAQLAKIKTDIDLNELLYNFNITDLETKGFAKTIQDKYTEINSDLRKDLLTEINKLMDEKVNTHEEER